MGPTSDRGSESPHGRGGDPDGRVSTGTRRTAPPPHDSEESEIAGGGVPRNDTGTGAEDLARQSLRHEREDRMSGFKWKEQIKITHEICGVECKFERKREKPWQDLETQGLLNVPPQMTKGGGVTQQ